MTRSKFPREVLLGAAVLAGAASLPRTDRRRPKAASFRHLGRRYAVLLNKEYRGTDPDQGRLGRWCRIRPAIRAALQNDRRAGLPRARPMCRDFRRSHVPDVSTPHRAAIGYGKLKNAGNLLPAMKYPYGVGHIYSGRLASSSEAVPDGARQLQRMCSIQKRNKLGIIDPV